MLRLRGNAGSDEDQGAHARLVQAIAAGDGTAAAVVSRSHLESLKAALA
jgi:DNA-binding FadR family transcriptional regulator